MSISSSLGTVTQTGTNSGTYTFTDPNVTSSTPITITATNSSGGITTTTFTINEMPPSLDGGQPADHRAGGGRGGGGRPQHHAQRSERPQPDLGLDQHRDQLHRRRGPAPLHQPERDHRGVQHQHRHLDAQRVGHPRAVPDRPPVGRVSGHQRQPQHGNQSARTISFSISPGTYNPDNGHFYQFFKNQGITWTAAKAAADASSVYGLKGYLATLTSAAENTFAFSKTLSTGWIGASDAANPGVWAWADGPESGLQFWSGVRNGTPVNGQYNDWNSGEPNDTGGVEFYAQYLNSGLWNDLANTSVVQGYLVEYGGSAGDPTLQLTSQATANVISISDVPAVTSPLAATSLNAPNTTITGTADAGSW